MTRNGLTLLLLIILLVLQYGCGKKETTTSPPPPPPSALPIITDFSPSSGTMGSTITLNGANFSTTINNNSIKLNGLPAKVTTASATQLQLIVPEGATTGKITVTVGTNTATSTQDFTVIDFSGPLAVKGMWVQFDKRGWPSGYYSGDMIKQFHVFDAVVGQTVANEVSQQLDVMKNMGVNTITLELRATDAVRLGGAYTPPECNTPPAIGFLYPQPTATELTNIVSFFNLVASKQMKIILLLNNTHMEEQPATNNTIWLTSILNTIKTHPALDLVAFGGNTKLVDNNGDGIPETCGINAEAPLWLGPTSKVGLYVKWAIQLGINLGIPPSKLTAEAIVGHYPSDLESPAGPDAAGNHLWRPVKVLKQIYDELGVPDNQRTYGVSMYEHPKCAGVSGMPCTEIGPDAWAEETLKNTYEIIGRNGSKVVAIEFGLLETIPNWNTSQAFESCIHLFKRYGVAGGCFWRWTYYEDAEANNPALTQPVKVRGPAYNYYPVKDKIVQYYK